MPPTPSLGPSRYWLSRRAVNASVRSVLMVCVPKIAVKAPITQEEGVLAHLFDIGRPDRHRVGLGVELPEDPRDDHRRQGHRDDHLGRAPPGVGDEDRVGEDHGERPQHAALDRRQEPGRIVGPDAVEHLDVLRRHEEDDQGREQRDLEGPELAERRPPATGQQREAQDQHREQQAVEHDGQRFGVEQA